MMDLVVPVLAAGDERLSRGQIYTIMCFVLILSGTLALNRRLYGHWSVLPLIAFPLLYNNVFLVGTMNYRVRHRAFAVGAGGVDLAARAQHRAAFRRIDAVRAGAVLLPSVLGRGLRARPVRIRAASAGTHCVAAGRCRFCSNVGRTDDLRRCIDFIACGLPFLPVIPLMLMSPTWTLRWDFNWELNGKLSGLIFVIEVYSRSATIFLAAIVAAAAAWSIRHRALQFHPFGWVLLVVGGVTYFVMPRVMFDTYMADQRLPIALAFMIIACAHLDLRDDLRAPWLRHGAGADARRPRVRGAERVARGFARDRRRFATRSGTSTAARKYWSPMPIPDNGDNARELWLMHAACLAIIERSALVTTAFTVLGKQVMHVRRNYRDRVDTEDGTPPSVKQLLQPSIHTDDDEPPYWSNWTSDYDYIYVLFTGTAYPNPDPERLAPVYAGNRFMLYKITAPVADADWQSEPPALQRFARFHVRRVALGSLQRTRAAAAQDAPSVDP